MPATVPYSFPGPGDAEAWRAQVRGAIGSTLHWQHVQGDEWVLTGSCPHCGDPMNQLFDFGTIYVPEVFGGSEFAPQDRELPLQVVCDCEGGHRPETRGCGFGKGIKVPLKRPVRG